MGIDAGEDVLEDVLGVVLGQAEPVRADRIHVTREPLDELVPGLRVTAPAPCDELRVRNGLGSHAFEHRREGGRHALPLSLVLLGSRPYADLTRLFGGTMTLRVVDFPPATL